MEASVETPTVDLTAPSNVADAIAAALVQPSNGGFSVEVLQSVVGTRLYVGVEDHERGEHYLVQIDRV